LNRPTLSAGSAISAAPSQAGGQIPAGRCVAMPKPIGTALLPGSGTLEVAVVAGHSTATRVVATNPLKFLVPRRPGPAAWIYTSTYGGGLVAGDEIDIRLRLGPGAVCVMHSQSSNKVYKSPAALFCRHRLHARVQRGATLILAPDQVTCFADARYEQDQRIDLAAGSVLVAVDWLTSGRQARGERWAFSRYRSRLTVFLEDEQLLAESLLLDPLDGRLDSAFRLGRFDCLALVTLVGDRLAAHVDDLLARVGRQPVGRADAGGQQNPIVEAISPIPHGAVLRLLGESSESVGQYLRSALSFLSEDLGDSLWARKW
jgi:urease accessory protein